MKPIYPMTTIHSRVSFADSIANNRHIATLSGQAIWKKLAWAYAAYWTVFVAGAFLGHKEFNDIGGVIILGILCWTVLERLWVKVDSVFIASMAAAFLPLLQVISSGTSESAGAYIKHLSLCLVMALSRLLRLPPAFDSRIKWSFAVQTLIILLISMTIYQGGSYDGGTRHAGLFANPNNLALIPLLLLFFVDRFRDRLVLLLGAHAMVIVVLAYSRTSGAVMAYAFGVILYLCSIVSREWRTLVYWSVALLAVLVTALIAVDATQFLPETRLVKQISVMRTQLGTVLSGEHVAYWAQEKVEGPGSASAVWRLAHWREVLAVYAEGTPIEQLFGFGPGSNVSILGILPHNEYLRLLFEQGIVGFSLFVFAWYRIIRTAPPSVRYVGLIFAIYSISENNLDNFPFMSLFIICLSANAADRCYGACARGKQLPNARPTRALRLALPTA
jgi:O-antigen ligase